ncbi:MAG: hypothetical protein FJX72_16235 [Armatimonadetes bacterium]|nr:hypothetical protein [Armatimonadota bacterium]
MTNVPASAVVGIGAAGFNEVWLRDRVYEDPSILGLGDLQAVSKETSQPQGGRLDLLLKNPDDDSMYEVELQLGPTDESHIIRTIEYWDAERRRWPKRSHTAVLVAERITNRFFGVIRLLSEAIPLIAIQACIVQVGDARALHFTKIIDTYEEPAEDEPATSSYDESYWLKCYPDSLECAKWYEALLQRHYGSVSKKHFEWYISYTVGGIARVWANRRKKGRASIEVKYAESPIEEAAEYLQNNRVAFTIRQGSVMAFNVSLDDLRQQSTAHEWLVTRIAPDALVPISD